MSERLRRWWRTSPRLCKLGLHVWQANKQCAVCEDWDE